MALPPFLYKKLRGEYADICDINIKKSFPNSVLVERVGKWLESDCFLKK